jgi:hypothetical protein
VTEEHRVVEIANPGGLPKVSIDGGNVARIADDLWAALSATNVDEQRGLDRPHTVFRFDRLCRFARDTDSRRLELREHDLDTLRDQLAHHVLIYKTVPLTAREGGDGYKEVEARPPNDAIMAILKRPADQLLGIKEAPSIDRIVDVPVFAPDGSLVERPGLHSKARVYYDGQPLVGLTSHWDDPGARAADVEIARYVLLEDLLGDFPFADSASRAHALSMLLEPFARSMIDGPAPAYAIIASEQGTGKSLLAQACLVPCCGRVDLQPEPEINPQDFQKRLLSELIRGPAAMVFDNVTRPLENSALAAMLTTGRYADRVLGKSQILSFPIRHVTAFTMNNPTIGPDLRRRVIPIYLDSGRERPWERTGPMAGRKWRHHNLLAWARENREDLVRAALTLIANYSHGWTEIDHAGDEQRIRQAPPRMMGTFEEWSTVIGGAVTAAGVLGFGGNLDRLFDDQSDDDRDLSVLLESWPEGKMLSATDVLHLVTVGLSDDVVSPPVEPPASFRDRSGRLTAQSVGYGLRSARDRVLSGRRLRREDGGGHRTLWRVEQSA